MSPLMRAVAATPLEKSHSAGTNIVGIAELQNMYEFNAIVRGIFVSINTLPSANRS